MKLIADRGIVAIGRFRASLQRMRLGGGFSLGAAAFHTVRQYRERAPREWERGALFAPVADGEALWLGFGESRPPVVRVQVGFGGLNASNGEPWGRAPDEAAANFFLCPGRPWLDGVYQGGTEPARPFSNGDKPCETLYIRLDPPGTTVTIYCVSPDLYRRVTGLDPPSPPPPEDVYDGSLLP